MNTGFLGPAVATVLTACGIETYAIYSISGLVMLQQYLPLAVLKHLLSFPSLILTHSLQQYLPFTVFNRIYDKTPSRLI